MPEPIKTNTQPMPIPVGARHGETALVVARPAALLAKLRAAVDEMDRAPDLPALRAAADRAAVAREAFSQVDRPAPADEVAKSSVHLLLTMPVAGNVDTELLTATACEVVAEERPTRFELDRAVRTMLRKETFFSVATFISAIRVARKAGDRYRRDLSEQRVTARIAEFERQLEHRRNEEDRLGRRLAEGTHIWERDDEEDGAP